MRVYYDQMLPGITNVLLGVEEFANVRGRVGSATAHALHERGPDGADDGRGTTGVSWKWT